MNTISVKTLIDFLTELDKWKQKRARPPKVILCSNNTVDGTTIPEYKQYNKAVVMRHHGTGTKTDTGISGTEPQALSAI